jgi:hypothetical protein
MIVASNTMSTAMPKKVAAMADARKTVPPRRPVLRRSFEGPVGL